MAGISARSRFWQLVPFMVAMCLLPLWWREWKRPWGCWAPLGPKLWYLCSWLKEDAGTPLWLLMVTEWIVSVVKYFNWEVYDTCRLWYCSSRVLLDLRTLPLGLGAIGYQDLNLYLVRIERTNGSEVFLSQSSCSSRASSIHDCSPGRTGDTGDF